MIKTLAVKIHEGTYPIAVAVLGAEFATTKKNWVMGQYLVLNDLRRPGYMPKPVVRDDECLDVDDEPRHSYIAYNRRAPRARWDNELVLTNFLMTKKQFKKEFEMVDSDDDKNQLFEIVQK